MEGNKKINKKQNLQINEVLEFFFKLFAKNKDGDPNTYILGKNGEGNITEFIYELPVSGSIRFYFEDNNNLTTYVPPENSVMLTLIDDKIFFNLDDENPTAYENIDDITKNVADLFSDIRVSNKSNLITTITLLYENSNAIYTLSPAFNSERIYNKEYDTSLSFLEYNSENQYKYIMWLRNNEER